jgi:peptide/nickel transport system substrate-binding protein
VYFQTIGNEALHPQTGFADWDEDFPNPSDFYLLLDARSIQAQNNENYGDVNDPKIQSELIKLDAVPATQLSSVASEWASLDEYVTQQAYFVSFGYQQNPIFASDNVNFSSIDFTGNDGMDWSTISLKK